MSAPTTDAKALLSSPHLASGIKKATRRLMPMLIILYFVAFLDRTNVGFAQEALEIDRGISAGAYALGAGIFFIGYAIFEIPSNLLLDKFGARFWLARIAITWGIVASAFAWVSNDTSFVILRFLLGVTEAGLFPGVIMFLAQWFPNQRARRAVRNLLPRAAVLADATCACRSPAASSASATSSRRGTAGKSCSSSKA